MRLLGRYQETIQPCEKVKLGAREGAVNWHAEDGFATGVLKYSVLVLVSMEDIYKAGL